MATKIWNALSAWYNARLPRAHTRWHMLLFIVVTVAGTVSLRYGLFSREIKLAISGIVFVVLVLWPLRYGYLGAIVSVVFLLPAATWSVTTWVQALDPYYLSIAVFQLSAATSAIIIARLIEKDRISRRELERAAIVDGLTGLYNHKHFVFRIQQELARRARTDETVSLMYIDLDNFKPVNDTFGHQKGDQYLQSFADLLTESIRADDTAYRLGGDEFAVILPGTGEDGARRVGERLREVMTQNHMGLPDGANKPSASIGISIAPRFAETAAELMTQADSALYHAKHAGRDQIRLFQDVFADILQHFSSGNKALIWSLKSLLWSAATRDHYTYGHSERVADYATAIAANLGLTPEEVSSIRIAGILHDIGRVQIPQEILLRPGPLAPDEREEIRKHPEYAATILKPLAGIGTVVEDVRHHHERMDGSGYPAGLAGEAIPIGARIIGVADAFDAMTSDRPYRAAMPVAQAIRAIELLSGSGFDPAVVRVASQTLPELVRGGDGKPVYGLHVV